MATSTLLDNSSLEDKANVLCRFFLSGNCRYGQNCYFSHDIENSHRESSVCKYYLLGCCAFGENCFFQHTTNNGRTGEADQINNSPSTPSTTIKSSSQSENENSETPNISSSSSSSTSSFSLTSAIESQSESNTKLVTRFANKPKLSLIKFSSNTDQEITNEPTIYFSNANANDKKPSDETKPTPASYYEALTGNKLENSESELDLNMFDENYIEYLNRRKLLLANSTFTSEYVLCPYFEKFVDCPFGENCFYTHGDVCDMCNMACLNPNDEKQRDEHRKECMSLIEKDMEEAFAVQRSSDKCCGICMEVVWQKENESDRRYGIMENCNHVFCLSCIRKWRASKSYENKIVKACPECRVKSDFVTPSRYWFDEKDEKSKKAIIKEYKDKLGNTACKYFKQGDGRCPFGNKCFYLHKNKDGTLAQLPDPTRRLRYNRSGGVESYSNVVTIDFDFSDDDDEFDFLEFFRHNILWDTETESDFSDLFELSDDFLM